MLAIGRSKHQDKRYGKSCDKIYSWSTYKSYLKHACYFVDFCRKEYGCRTLDECKPYATKWINSRKCLSAYTQKLELAALKKLYQDDFSDIVTDQRLRSEITRSRNKAIRDKNFSESRNSKIVAFCRSTGLRRAELRQIRCGDIGISNDGIFVAVTRATKGGRPRLVKAYPDESEKAILEEICRSALAQDPEQKIFPKISSNMDIHSYRAEYATRVYNMVKRDISTLERKDKYICRKDRKGLVYDKMAMLEASQALGHNRIDVVAGHYLIPEEIED